MYCNIIYLINILVNYNKICNFVDLLLAEVPQHNIPDL